MALDLLNERLLGIRRRDLQEERSLPEVLALLASGEEGVEFRGLQPFQEPPWHAFLVQVAAMALERADVAEPPTEAGPWRDLLLLLSGEEESAWHLLVDDLRRPAFFQPPIPEATLDVLKNESDTPEALSVLVLAKNHDVKAEQFRRPAPDDWLYALLTLQTTQGFSGRDNYGIARMNGGFGSRAQVAVVTSLDWSHRFRTELRLARRVRRDLLGADRGFSADGTPLLWLPPWDGLESADLSQLDPLFVEICRRVRLTGEEEELRVRWGTSKAPRVAAKDLLGDLGDPWMPIRKKDHAALTVSERGFDYRLLTRLIFPDSEFEPAPAQKLDLTQAGEAFIVARVLVRGQGQTGGYHERIVPIHRKVARRWGVAPERARLGSIAQQRIEEARDAQNKVLKPAILALHQGGPEKLNFKDAAADEALAGLDRDIDRVFFERLWADSDLPSEERQKSWHRALLELARRHFEHAVERAPRPDARHYRAVAAAERAFYGAARRVLKEAFEKESPRPMEEGNEHAA